MTNVAKKVMLVGKATTFMVGLAVILALTVGVASTALAGTGIGARLDLGKTNTVNAVTKLVGSVAGPSLQIDNNSADAGATALDLQVEPDKAPMKVNSDAQVANLNADKLDGKSADQLGLTGLEHIEAVSASNSNSGKGVTATCPAGKVLLSSGYNINGGFGGSAFPNFVQPIAASRVDIQQNAASVSAVEVAPTSDNWSVYVEARCANAP